MYNKNILAPLHPLISKVFCALSQFRTVFNPVQISKFVSEDLETASGESRILELADSMITILWCLSCVTVSRHAWNMLTHPKGNIEQGIECHQRAQFDPILNVFSLIPQQNSSRDSEFSRFY